MRWLPLLAMVFTPWAVAAAPPVTTDNRLVIELVAEHPDIVTPTGIAVDEEGRVWIIENHTHQRPPTYKGPAHDRIRIFSDPGPDGKFRKITTFADGFKNAMSLALHNNVVYLATRSEIFQLRDTKGTGEADEKKSLIKLDTEGNYPHNGLSGFAFHPMGEMYFGLGENLGAPYKLIGSDGTTLSGGGEGGSVYRCKLDGSKLERVATGFWNPFHMTFDAFGRLFAVDNDPDARGPCRLLHVVQGGDYGYRFRNGRKGLHPFTAWNGELPGTLPMVAGTAEAPSGIIAYESIGLPAEYRGKLLVTSWGDHVIESFTLKEKGASFSATSTILVKGGEDFRPVGIVTAPDGSLYVSDWVNKSYPVHGQGRIWRIRMKEPPKDDGLRTSKLGKMEIYQLKPLLSDPRSEIRGAAFEALMAKSPNEWKERASEALKESTDSRTRMNALWVWGRVDSFTWDESREIRGEAVRLLVNMKSRALPGDLFDHPFVLMQGILHMGHSKGNLESVVATLANPDPFLVSAAVEALGRLGSISTFSNQAEAKDPKLRLGVALAMRRTGDKEALQFLPRFLADPDPAVRRFAIQWVGEDRLKQYRVAMEQAAAKEPVTKELFEALLASQDFLSNSFKPNLEAAGEGYVAKIVKDDKQPAVFRTFGLRMLRPDHPVLTWQLMEELLKSPEASLRGEAARTLALRADFLSQSTLRQLLRDRDATSGLRAIAVMGLTHSITESETRKRIFALLEDPVLRRDAMRTLRDAQLSAEERQAIIRWWERVSSQRDLKTDDKRELAEQMLLLLGTNEVKEEEALRKSLTELVGPAPANEAAWQNLLGAPGDMEAGERVFFHARGARCAVCHRIDGRGGQIGPELSQIAKSHNRAKLIESILTPSKEIAPMFTTWNITMQDGRKFTGVILGENFDSTITLADAEGKLIKLKKLEIDERQPSTKSLMPDDLHKQMTRREMVDLLEYLGARR